MIEQAVQVASILGSVIIGIVGPAMFVYYLFTDRTILRVNLDALLKFASFMILVTVLRAGIMHNNTAANADFDMGRLLWVFLEDAGFVLPMFIARKYLTDKFFYVFIFIISVIFALGHVYQSHLWAFITLFYPYFISYKYSKKHGMGTVMLGHIFYDIITVLTVKVMYLINMLDL